jgi:hypothetical protein
MTFPWSGFKYMNESPGGLAHELICTYRARTKKQREIPETVRWMSFNDANASPQCVRVRKLACFGAGQSAAGFPAGGRRASDQSLEVNRQQRRVSNTQRS